MKCFSPDARGWIGLGVFFLTVMVLWMTAFIPELREDEFFKSVAVLIIGTGFINGVVSWAYAATKQGGELADRATAMVEQRSSDQPQPVKVVNPADDPVPVEVEKPAPTYTGPDAADIPPPPDDVPEDAPWR